MYICLYIFSERQSLIARRIYDRWTLAGWEVRGGLSFKEHFSWVSISMWKTKEEPYKKRQQLVEKSLECSGNKMYAPRMKKKALDFVAGERSSLAKRLLQRRRSCRREKGLRVVLWGRELPGGSGRWGLQGALRKRASDLSECRLGIERVTVVRCHEIG